MVALFCANSRGFVDDENSVTVVDTATADLATFNEAAVHKPTETFG
jgi:hypothetical protein